MLHENDGLHEVSCNVSKHLENPSAEKCENPNAEKPTNVKGEIHPRATTASRLRNWLWEERRPKKSHLRWNCRPTPKLDVGEGEMP
jgi:hypothetical protein